MPRDQRGASEAIARADEIRAGYSAAPEDVTAEREWLARLGQQKGAAVSEIRGDAHDLVDALRRGDIDLIIGLPAKTPFKKEIGLSRPYGDPQNPDRKRAWAVRPGENAWLYDVDRLLMQETGR